VGLDHGPLLRATSPSQWREPGETPHEWPGPLGRSTANPPPFGPPASSPRRSLFETGIKGHRDLLTPYVLGGKIGLFRGAGASQRTVSLSRR
jgi:hypothetical protein